MIPLRPAARIALALVALAGCGGESEGATGLGGAGGAAGECAPPNRLVGDACREPGVQDDGCPAGTLGLGDGACRPAGIPPEMCGEGFVHDGDAGCEPILPAEQCPPGQMAVPGETACRPVMPCAPGTWGDIPTDATTEHVDGSFAGGGSDGSAQKPWTTIGAAIAAAAPGAIVAVAAGSYAEDVDILGKPVVLWGVCPDEVEIVGTAAALAAVDIREQASGTVLRGLAITGAAAGVALSGSEQVLLDELWVHDNADRGLNIQGNLGPTSCTVRSSLVEQNHDLGVLVDGSEATIEATVVRGTLPDAQRHFGRGINVQKSPDTGAPSTAVVRSSLVEQNREFGVAVSGSEATIEATVVRGTLPDAQGLTGRGINIRESPDTGAPSTAVVRSSLVEQNRDLGVVVSGSEATIEATVVRGTLPDAQGLSGNGIKIQESLRAGAASVATVRSSLVEQNHEFGVLARGSKATVEATVVRGTLPNAQELYGTGVGIGIDDSSDTGAASTAVVRSSLVQQSRRFGVWVSGSEAIIEGTVVRDTLPGAQGLFGRGIQIELEPDIGAPSAATVRSSLVEQDHEFGVLSLSSDVAVEGCLVRATLPNAEARFGDGISASSVLGPASLSVSATRIEDSARAGVSSFGASVSLGDTAVQCAAFDLEGEPYKGAPFTFDNRGGNVCGCPSAEGECLLETVGIEPPTPVTPVE